jgi:hypothetical protein
MLAAMPSSSVLLARRFALRLFARVALTFAVVASLWSSTAAAAGKKAPSSAWVVLVHVSGEVPAEWSAPLQQAAQGAAPDRKWVPTPGTPLDELQLALGCADWDAACAGHVGESVGAGNVVLVSLQARGKGVVVGASVVGADGTVVSTGDPLALSSTSPNDLQAAERWVAAFVRGARPAVLLVNSDLAGDEVLLDGVLVGRTPLIVVDVAPGAHALQVRRAGRAPLQRSITVAPGATVREDVALSSTGPKMMANPTVGTDEAVATSTTSQAAWGLAGVGGLVTVVGGVLAVVNGLPVLEATMNQTDGTLNRSYRPLFGEPVEGAARFDFLAQRFGTDAAKVQNPADFSVILERATMLANVGIALLSAGGVLTATGIGLALTGEEAPPATTSPKTSPKPTGKTNMTTQAANPAATPAAPAATPATTTPATPESTTPTPATTPTP